MPSVFDFGFQTSHYSIPNDSLNGFGDYTINLMVDKMFQLIEMFIQIDLLMKRK